MERARHLLAPAWVLALVLILFPAADLIGVIWPLRARDTSWRIGTTGVVASMFPMMLLGLAVAYGAALLAGRRVVVRGVGMLAALGTLSLVTILGLFLLDVLQLRVQVVPEAMARYDAAGVKAFFKLVVGIIAAGIVSYSALASSRRSKVESRAQKGDSESPLVFGSGAEAKAGRSKA